MFRRIAITLIVVCVSLFVFAALADEPVLGIGGKVKPVSIPCAVSIQPDTVVGGATVECTVTLDQVVEEDQVVSVETDHPEVYSGFPESVVVSAGNDSVTFDLTTVTVSGSVATTVYASCNGGQASDTLTVTP
ncbi:MAG: hypothetical protein GX446_03385 [Chthonomonadales bacterium]|nr:hypothetical protein [Chthonomonadales bacterium]